MSAERIADLLRPRSIAVIGATENPHRIASEIVSGLIATGYTGEIFPVNPRYETLNGRRCYASLEAIDRPVDHCIVAIGREHVLGVIEACARCGVKGATIISSGYAELGAEGAADQAALVRAANGMPFLGPNCLGYANYVDAIFPVPVVIVQHHRKPGDVGFLVQSGGVGFATSAFVAQESRIRFSYIINTGNSAGISYADTLEFLFTDPHTRVVVAAAESETCVAELIATVRHLGLLKPVVLLKVGRGDTGVQMAASHTGAIAGDYRVIKDLAEQIGIICAEDVDEAFGIAALLRAGVRADGTAGVASFSVSGDNIALFADQVDEKGLGFADISPDTVARLSAVLPSFVAIRNPVDMTIAGHEDPAVFGRVAEILADDPAVKIVVPILTTEADYTEVCGLLLAARERLSVPMVILWTGGSFETRSRDLLDAHDQAVVRSPALLARCLAAIGRGAAGAESAPSAEAPLWLPTQHGALTEAEAFQLLHDAGLPVADWRVCPKAGLADAAAAIGFPVMVKTDSAETHISDKGGVLGPFRNAADLAAAAPAIAAMPGDHAVAMRYLPGLELIASVFRHPRFGALLMVGSGGTLTELHADAHFLALPATRPQMEQALRRCLVGRAIATGHRGHRGLSGTLDFLDRLARIGLGCGARLGQIELNPVTVGPHGTCAVDAAVILAEPAGPV